MKMSILIHIMPKGEYFIAQTSWSAELCGQNMKIIAHSKTEALSIIRKSVSAFIEGFGRRHIESWASHDESVNCPEGYVKLPIDLWYCKHTKKRCPVQAEVNIANSEYFFERCLASDETKNGIWNAINKGEYKGFHHVVGRYKCGSCDNSRRYYNYHYPWELTLLSEHCDMESIWSDVERAKELIRKDFPRAAKYTALCCDCFKKVARLFPEIDLSEYEIITHDYQRNK